MVAHSRKGRKPHSRSSNKNNNNNNNNNNNGDVPNMTSLPITPIAAAPPCVAKLHAQDWNVVEEGCADVTAFALQPTQFANLLAHGVPQRLAELLFTSSLIPSTPETAINNNNNNNNNGETTQQQQEVNGQELQSSVDRGVLYMQTAAAEALRNMVVNSVEDAVVDMLASTSFPICHSQEEKQEQQQGKQQGFAFRDGLVTLLLSMWDILQKTRQDIPPVMPIVDMTESADDEVNDNDTNRKVNSAPFMAASRALEEVLQLIVVCVEGSEHIADAFSTPLVVKTLLSMLEVTTSIVWEALQHPAQLYVPTPNTNDTDNTNNNNDNNNNKGHVLFLRHYKRREAEVLAAVAVAASEVLHVLSGENDALSSMLQSAEMMAPHQAFLTDALDAPRIMNWLREEVSPSSSPSMNTMNTTAEDGNGNSNIEEDPTLLSVGRQNILYHLCELSLHVQGTLVNAAANIANASRVLPLTVAVLDAHPPHSEWRRTVPLLLQTCPLPEISRVACVTRAVRRLRCDQAAAHVLHAAVDAVCSSNAADLDDEAAFQQNPQASILYSTNAMYVVGKLMKDALRLPTHTSNSNNNNNNGGVNHLVSSDVMGSEEDIMVERALRTAAGTSGTGGLITKLQLLVLSNEVAVWSLANTLLLMVPWSGLGEEPSHIWRAIINAVNVRSKLLADAAAEASAVDLGPEESSNNNNNNGPGAKVTAVVSSPSAMHLLWLQLESLVQMLWTMQRKQTASAGGALQTTNQLGTCPSDVDVITRLAWEPRATPLQRQASVGTVCAMCGSFHTAEATAVATRFALAILHVDETTQATTTNNNNSGTMAAPPAGARERRQWIAKFTAVDAQWRVRCEAANHIMDLFLDETYDESVYIPLQVHAALQSFLTLFKAYQKRRQQLTREVQRNYRVVLPEVEDAPHWCEVTENLEAFLDYKKEHIRAH